MGDLILPFMAPVGPQQHETESYVSVPPALTITDETGAIWTLGFRVGAAPRGEFAFNVLRNGIETGEIASRIERRSGRIRVFTARGWTWMPQTWDRVAPTRIYALGIRPVPCTVVALSLYRVGALDALGVYHVGGEIGGVLDLRRKPLQLAAREWVQAACDPACPGVEVTAVIGDGLLRSVVVAQHHMEESHA